MVNLNLLHGAQTLPWTWHQTPENPASKLQNNALNVFVLQFLGSGSFSKPRTNTKSFRDSACKSTETLQTAIWLLWLCILNLKGLKTDLETHESSGFSKPLKSVRVARSSCVRGVLGVPIPETPRKAEQKSLRPSKLPFGRTGCVAHCADLPPPQPHLKRSGLPVGT